MDTLDGMRAFSAVVATGSFTAAAERLGISTALVSKYVAQLEERLGVRLLNRTTRSQSLTEVGRAYHERCLTLLEDFDNLEASVQERQTSLQGRLLVSAPRTFGEMYLARAAAEFLEREEGVSLDLRLTDRFVDLVDEGFDLAVRIGELEDSGLIARRLFSASVVACASPDYLARFGMPEDPRALLRHRCIVDSNYRSGASWNFVRDGERVSVRVPARCRVNSALAAREMALAGGGIAIAPSFVVAADMRAGRLQPVLPDCQGAALSVYAVYPHNRHLTAKVRCFVDFLVGHFAKGEKGLLPE